MFFIRLHLSRWMGSFSKWAKKVFGRKTGRTLPICIANIVVFFVVGVWHGAAWKYIIYGLYNGLIIAFSGLMAGNYRSWKKKLHISGKETWYYVFTVIRTFILTVISMYFDRPDNMGVALHMMKLSVTRFNPSQILLIPAGKQGTTFTPYALAYPCGRMCDLVCSQCTSGERYEDQGISGKTSSSCYSYSIFLSADFHRILWFYSSSERFYLCTVLKKY